MWNLRPDERLREWKNFRDRIGKLSLAQACEATSHFWSYAPYVTHYIDPDKDHSAAPWPDPWTLVHENYYCDLAKTLGMLYTLYLSSHRPTDIELLVYRDPETKEQYNLVSLSKGKYILNFQFDCIVNKKQLPKNLELKFRYSADDLQLNLY